MSFSSFQTGVTDWLFQCFGHKISSDKMERADRLIEEQLELVQSVGYPAERVIALLHYVYSRPIGEPHQETGGVMVTLAAFCWSHGIDLEEAANAELARVWTKVDAIRAKQAAKPTGSALPTHHAPSVAMRAEDFARQLWGYFTGNSTGSATAMQWFDNNKSLGGPAHIIELCRSALSAQVQDLAAKSLADAYQKYLDASRLYNERLAISKTKPLGTMRVDEERRAIDEARRAFDKLAVDIAISALPAAPADKRAEGGAA